MRLRRRMAPPGVGAAFSCALAAARYTLGRRKLAGWSWLTLHF
jgi:hypothetical protein